MRVVENALRRRRCGRYQRAAAVYQTFIDREWRHEREREREREVRPELDITKIVCRRNSIPKRTRVNDIIPYASQSLPFSAYTIQYL